MVKNGMRSAKGSTKATGDGVEDLKVKGEPLPAACLLVYRHKLIQG